MAADLAALLFHFDDRLNAELIASAASLLKSLYAKLKAGISTFAEAIQEPAATTLSGSA